MLGRHSWTWCCTCIGWTCWHKPPGWVVWGKPPGGQTPGDRLWPPSGVVSLHSPLGSVGRSWPRWIWESSTCGRCCDGSSGVRTSHRVRGLERDEISLVHSNKIIKYLLTTLNNYYPHRPSGLCEGWGIPFNINILTILFNYVKKIKIQLKFKKLQSSRWHFQDVV